MADLFLDTIPYGAHTTASDALWCGVPVLTLSGRSFASRVCGSLVTAAGLPELVCHTPTEFVERAIQLGLHREQRQPLAQRLRENRRTCTLFDTPLLVRELEALYGQMWAEQARGELPRPDLKNLEAYLEVGSTLEPDLRELETDAAYEAFWLERLERRHRQRPLEPDSRLLSRELLTTWER